MGGRDFCCILGCNNRRSAQATKLSFHKIPSKPASRRSAWIKAAGRTDFGKNKFVVTEYTRVCGAHFVKGKKNSDPSDIDYIPTVNLPTPTLKLTPSKPRSSRTSTAASDYSNALKVGNEKKIKQTNKRTGKVETQCDIDDIQNEVEVSSSNQYGSVGETEKEDLIILEEGTREPTDHDYSKPGYKNKNNQMLQSSTTQTDDEICNPSLPKSENGTQCEQTPTLSTGTQIDTYSSEEIQISGGNLTAITVKNQGRTLKSMKQKVQQLTKEKNEAKKYKFCVENMLKSDDNVLFYCGLPNLATFNALFEYLKEKAAGLNFWRGKDTKDEKSASGKGPQQKLSLENQFFATLVRLKLGLFVEDLANRFGVSTAYISRMFNTWVRFLRLELELLFPYPSAEEVHENTPETFHRYPNTRMIIDCTEVFIQKPTALKAQRQTWSNYKHQNTYKVLVGITPDGSVCYISSLYGGTASDKFIVNDSGFLNIIEPGDNIMADRGFVIADELRKRGATLNIPPFRNGKYQLSAEEVEETRRIAEVRIHVERAIQRIKSFHILSGVMPLTLHMVAEDIFKTCAYLINFQTPIIKPME